MQSTPSAAPPAPASSTPTATPASTPVAASTTRSIQAPSRVWMGLLGTTLFALGIAFLFHTINPRNLDLEALDCAQIGRNIAAGHGFTTDFIRPVMLSSLQPGTRTPDLVNAPLMPLLSGIAQALAGGREGVGARDGIIVALSLALYALSAALLFALARRLTGNPITAGLAVGVYAFSQATLSVADSGHPLVLATCLVLSMLVALTPPDASQAPAKTTNTSDKASPGKMTGRESRAERSFLWAGVLASLCYLSLYLSPLYVLPLAFFWGRATGGWNKRTIGLFALGFALTALPWWIRNARLTGNPFFSLQWLELAMNTRAYPGFSLYRDPTAASNALAPGVASFGGKMLRGLSTYFYDLAGVPHLYLMPFVLMTLWARVPGRILDRAKWGVPCALAFYVLGLCALGRNGAVQLLPLAPLLALLGAWSLTNLASDRFASWREAREPIHPARVFAMRLTCGAALLVLLCLPFTPLIWNARPDAEASLKSRTDVANAINKSVPAGKMIATDVPWNVAWDTHRPALWLPNRVDDLAASQAAGTLSRSVGAIYLSRAILGYGSSEGMNEWKQVYSQGRDLPGYSRNTRLQERDVIYVKQPSLAEAERAAKAQPQNAALQADLGRARQEAGQLQPALAAFQQALRLRPSFAQAYAGLGMTYAQLGDNPNALQNLNKALSLAPRFLPAQMAKATILQNMGRLDEATATYEQVVADNPNQWIAVNNLAVLYTQTGKAPYRAIEMARRSVLNNPENGSMWDTLSWACYGAGRYAESAGYGQRAAQLAPRSGTILYHLGKALIGAGKKEIARQVLQRALSLGLSPAEKTDTQSLLSTLTTARPMS